MGACVPQAPKLALVVDHDVSGTRGPSLPPPLAAFVSARTPSALARLQELRVREGILEVGDRATAYGRLATERVAEGDGGGYRDAPTRRVIRALRKREKVLVSDFRSTLGASS